MSIRLLHYFLRVRHVDRITQSEVLQLLRRNSFTLDGNGTAEPPWVKSGSPRRAAPRKLPQHPQRRNIPLVTRHPALRGPLQMNSRCATKSPARFSCVAGMLRMDPPRSRPCPHWHPAVCCGCCGKFSGSDGVKIRRRSCAPGHQPPMDGGRHSAVVDITHRGRS